MPSLANTNFSYFITATVVLAVRLTLDVYREGSIYAKWHFTARSELGLHTRFQPC